MQLRIADITPVFWQWKIDPENSGSMKARPREPSSLLFVSADAPYLILGTAPTQEQSLRTWGTVQP